MWWEICRRYNEFDINYVCSYSILLSDSLLTIFNEGGITKKIMTVFTFQVTDFLFFLSKILLTLGVGAVCYVIFITDLVSPFIDNSSLKYGAVPVAFIMICTFLISSLFFSVYSMAVDTLFLCFCKYPFFITRILQIIQFLRK